MTMVSTCEKCGWTVVSEATVTIPADEYKELLRAADAVDAGVLGKRQLKRRAVSPIVRDPELGAFLVASAATMTYSDIRAACLAKFGKRRAPSLSAIGRYLKGRSNGR